MILHIHPTPKGYEVTLAGHVLKSFRLKEWAWAYCLNLIRQGVVQGFVDTEDTKSEEVS